MPGLSKKLVVRSIFRNLVSNGLNAQIKNKATKDASIEYSTDSARIFRINLDRLAPLIFRMYND